MAMPGIDREYADQQMVESGEAALSVKELSVVHREKKSSEFWGWVRFIIGLGVAYFLVMHLIGLTRVSGDSMNPSLKSSNILLINKWSTYWDSPAYGDVVVIRSPKLSYDIVKRVIAVSGDRVRIEDGEVYVNDNPLAELYCFGVADPMAEVSVGKSEVFVLGDNRTPGESLDSRSLELGLIAEKDIKGYALFRLIPWGGIPKPIDLGG